jgi:hypothetical protein
MNKTLMLSLVAFLTLPSLAWTKDKASNADIQAPTGTAANVLDPAWEELEKKAVRLLGQEGQRKLVDMAYAEVGADACPGIKVDNKAFNATFDAITADTKKERNADQQRAVDHQSMAYLGVYVGLLLSESYGNREKFCQDVERVKGRQGGPSVYWIKS